MVTVRPELLASCPCCGCLVLAFAFHEATRTLVEVWDPTWTQRRLIRSHLSPEDVRRQGFGLIRGGPHECPPEEECALGPVGRRRKGRCP